MDRHREVAVVERESHDHAGYAQTVIAVEVADADTGHRRRRQAGAGELPLRALPRIEQDCPAVPTQQRRVVIAVPVGAWLGGAQHHDLARAHPWASMETSCTKPDPAPRVPRPDSGPSPLRCRPCRGQAGAVNDANATPDDGFDVKFGGRQPVSGFVSDAITSVEAAQHASTCRRGAAQRRREPGDRRRR